MVANYIPKHSRMQFNEIIRMIEAQLYNSFQVGWKPKDIILITTFPFELNGVTSIQVGLNEKCLTGSKVFGMRELFNRGLVNDVVWSHDLDAWQNVPFEAPDFKDIGLSEYSRPKFNGGSIFYKPSAKDIVETICHEIENNKEQREEPTINRLLRADPLKHRVTTLDHSYNVGCSGFVPRYEKSIKPIKVCHFHPLNRIAWETHTLDRNGIDEIPVTKRLERAIRRFWPTLATALQKDGVKKAEENRKKRKGAKK